MNIIEKAIKDFQRAGENFEQYQKMQAFYKGKNSEPMALIDFMYLDYLPKSIVNFIRFKANCINKFLNWWMDFHRLSFLTLLMIIAIIYIVSEIV